MTKKPENADRTLSLGLYVLFGLLVLGAGIWFRSDLTDALYSLEATVNSLGYWGPALLVLVAALWAILCLPGPVVLGFIGTVLNAKPLLALLVCVLADSIAEAVGFLLARHFGRARVAEWLAEKPWFQWLEEQTESKGAYAVLVIRMMPFFPNSLANYALGLSSLRFWPYFLASVLGSIPNLAIYVGGTAGVIHLLRTGMEERTLWGAAVIFALTILVLVVLQSVLRRHGRLVEWRPDDANGDSSV